MREELKIMAYGARAKVLRALELLNFSLARVQPFDSSTKYDFLELEPYDALADRFVRAVEVALRFMRTLEQIEFAEQSDTLRDLLHRMEKLGVVSNTGLWLEMRDVRNRVVHDYLPEKIKAIYDDILGQFGEELLNFRDKVRKYELE